MLFGSQAKGRAREDSDVDVGVLPSGLGLSLAEELELARQLSEACGLEVDVVRLDRDDPLLGYEAARHGLPIWETVAGNFAAYRARAISTWLDFEETVAPHRKTYLLRLARRTG